MDKPVLSPDFTIDDIHKLREYNYEKRKGMSNDEMIADIRKGASRAQMRIAELKKEKKLVAN